MINSETNCIGGTNVIPANDKLPSTVTKKTALRDVQNQNGSFFSSHQEKLAHGGRGLTTDAVKVCGTKRLTPERPSTSPSQLFLSGNAVNEHVMNARRRFELELGRGKISNMDKYADCPLSRQLCQLPNGIPQRQTQLRESVNTCVAVAASNNLTSPTNFPYNGPSVPNFGGKYGRNTQAPNFHKISSELPRSVNSESIGEQRRTERFIRLQTFLKQCDESYQGDYIQMLLCLSPPELSGHAVELENRTIQLTIEEGKEIQRMKALNILEKSAPATNSLQRAHCHQSRN